MLLNGWHDREIHGYTAIDCVEAVCSSLNRKQSQNNNNNNTNMTSSNRRERSGSTSLSSSSSTYELHHPPCKYITHLLVPRGGLVYQPSVDGKELENLGIRLVEVDAHDPQGNGQFRFDADALVRAIDAITVSTPQEGEENEEHQQQ